jgi:hypothetical protein
MREKIGNWLNILHTAYFVAVMLPLVVGSAITYFLFPTRRLGLFWYNIDRSVASMLWQTSQETISSEVGRIAIGAGKPDGWTPKWRFEAVWTKAVARWLNTDTKLWGIDHTRNAIEHADELDHADNGREQ